MHYFLEEKDLREPVRRQESGWRRVLVGKGEAAWEGKRGTKGELSDMPGATQQCLLD